ncbi:hypothetical protein AWU65_03110 [Paenibacillus glucanolyticus]|uniref:Uncharacterized protein n=1 Tax=Paenibacillus glucanolyticus TaxID=59843 RepID=A0A163GI57_9BACL|nr:hypothetical protein AWU65_03110 [Paenibacillus glucanolyticus]OMF64803.1 hypothetical protein BK142_31400 [Paenibacillus glucanolyticus]
MFPVIIVSLIIFLLLFMFIKGYIHSKNERAKKEKAFREELLLKIKENTPSFQEETMSTILSISTKDLTSYLEENTLIHQDVYNQLLKKHFEPSK